MLKSNLEAAPNVKLLFNIGATLDIPTGFYLKGRHGEYILLAGLGMLTGVVGRGNTFKSTVLHYMMLSAANRITSAVETSMSTYDTEINIHEEHLRRFIEKFEYLAGRDLFEEGTWTVTDKVKYYGNEYFEKTKEYVLHKIENAKKLTAVTPFLTRDKVTLLETMIPTFSEVDSFTDFETSDVSKIRGANELGDSGQNMVNMRQGLAKMNFLSEAPRVAGSGNHFMLLAAQVGDHIEVAASPYAQPAAKQLPHMKQNEKMKGVTGKFTFMMNNCFQTTRAMPLMNQGTKGPEYPRDGDEAGDMDLNLVTIKQLRSKSGPTGYNLDLLVSQTEGVHPSLTEFHYIKEMDRFGLSGTLQHYSLDLLPDVKLSRTTVRGKLDNDAKLRRAMNITSELCQMFQFYRHLREELMTPKFMHEKLTSLGYDVNFILERTRGWWTFNNDKHELLFLSTYDLVNMCNETYHPFWLEDDKKTVKKEYLIK